LPVGEAEMSFTHYSLSTLSNPTKTAK